MRSSRQSRILVTSLIVSWSVSAAAQQPDLTFANPAHYRGTEGKRLTVVCPPGVQAGTVYGTDVYTDDSSICGAALHAGVIRAAEGGVVTIVTTKSQESYAGSARNGVTSRSYSRWNSSFTVAKGDGGDIDWTTRARGIETVSRPVAVVCPPNGKTDARIWGTDTYTDDTPICVAAVHAGVITPAGGRVVVEPAAGETLYEGTVRNGVTSQPYHGRWPGSFRFAGRAPQSVAVRVPASVVVQTPSPVRTSPTTGTSGSATAAKRQTSEAAKPAGTAASTGAAPTGTTLSTQMTAEANSRVAAGRSAPALPEVTDPPAVHATNFRAGAGYGVNVLTWTAAPGAIGYRLARASWDPVKMAFMPGNITIPGGPAEAAGGLISDTTYTDRAVTAGIQYVYWLDSYYRSSEGGLYFPDPGSYPTVTVNPRDPAGATWLPADWKEAVKGMTVRIKDTTISGTGGQYGHVILGMEWQSKASAIGYQVTRVFNWIERKRPDGSMIDFETGAIPVPVKCGVLAEQTVDPRAGSGQPVPGLAHSFVRPGFIFYPGSPYSTAEALGTRLHTSYCFAIRAVYPGLDPVTNTFTAGGGRAIFSDPVYVRFVSGNNVDNGNGLTTWRFSWSWQSIQP